MDKVEASPLHLQIVAEVIIIEDVVPIVEDQDRAHIFPILDRVKYVVVRTMWLLLVGIGLISNTIPRLSIPHQMPTWLLLHPFMILIGTQIAARLIMLHLICITSASALNIMTLMNFVLEMVPAYLSLMSYDLLLYCQ